MTTARPAWPQLANVAVFVGALALGGAMLLLSPSAGGETSDDENRTLAPAPTLTTAALLDGTYTTALEAFVADHFPRRDTWIAVNFWLKDHRGFRDEQLAVYDLGDAGIGDDGWDALVPLDDDDPLTLAAVDSPTPHPQGDDATHAAIALDLDIADDPEADPKAERPSPRLGPRPRSLVRRGIIVSEGRAMQIFTAGKDGSPAYARMIKTYADALAGMGVKTYVVIVPTAQAFYLPDFYRRHADAEPANIRATVALLPASVTAVDAFAALDAHQDEYIYFRSDHHWTGRGAYYAYEALCKAMGLTPNKLEAMERRQTRAFHGPLYKFTRDLMLEEKPDHAEYWLPPVATTTTRYSNSAPDTANPGKLLVERGSGYGVFLGGDAPLMVVKTAENPGRRALLLKNSYGNAFAVFLAAHFEELLIVDYRHYRGRLLDLIDQHKITDLVILNGSITANANLHINRLAEVLDRQKLSPPAGDGPGE